MSMFIRGCFAGIAVAGVVWYVGRAFSVAAALDYTAQEVE